MVTIPLPDTAWTAGTEDAVAFSQAGPGTLLGGLPAAAGRTINPRGSLYINATLTGGSGGGGIAFNLDCQPGRFVEPAGATFLALSPTVFENAHVVGGSARPPQTPTARVRLRTGAPFTATRTTLRLPLLNAGTAVGTGRVVVRSAARVRVGSRRPAIVTLATGAYRIAPGGQPTRTLRLTAAGRALMATRPSLRTRVVITPRTGAVVSRIATLSGPLR